MGLVLVAALFDAGVLRGRGADRVPTGGERHLLSAGAENVTCDGGFDQNGGVVLYLLGTLYMFVGLAIVCDDYFVASLEAISEALNLSENVAGATFMAAGSSAPELATSFMSVFGPGNDLGAGAIVGSAIFNILIIIGLTGAFAGQALLLDWRPMARDISFYSISIFMLAGAFWDSQVDYGESLMLFFGYIAYILYMVWSDRIQESFCRAPAHMRRARDEADESASTAARSESKVTALDVGGDSAATEVGPAEAKAVGAEEDAKVAKASDAPTSAAPALRQQSAASVLLPRLPTKSDTDLLDRELATIDAQGSDGTHRRSPVRAVPPLSLDGRTASVTDINAPPSIGNFRAAAQARLLADDGFADFLHRAAVVLQKERTQLADPSILVGKRGLLGGDKGLLGSDAGEDDEEDESPFAFPETLVGRIYYFIRLPYNVVYYLTIPDCATKRWEKWYLVTFFASIAWIGFLSWFMVDWASRIGCILGIPSSVMGLTVLAAGTSVPDALSSLSVARSGAGDMAVSNAIGSNVFDILLGLGLPWVVYTCMAYPGEVYPVSSGDMLISVVILFAVVLIVLFTLLASKWRLYPTVGWSFFGVYFLFIAWTLLNLFVFEIKWSV